MKPIIKTSALSIGYAEKTIASGINLELLPGALISVVGANGSGKSTLLRTLCGLQPRIGGSLMLEDRDLLHYTALERARKISLVLTEKPASGALSVRELVALGRQPYTDWIGTMSADDLKAVDRALNMTAIGHLQHKKVGELSDGQLQKAMIARALAQDTEIIILDEPSTHLDLIHKLSLFRMLKQMAQLGKCIVFSTHDIEAAISISDAMILIAGRKVHFGSPADLIDSGIFETLFPTDEVSFDRESVKFILKGL